jgi:hypothetical protein
MRANDARCSFLTAGALLASAAAEAQPAVADSELRRCAEIAADAARLACFDALARSAVGAARNQESETPTAAAPVATEPAADDVEAFGAELVDGGASMGPEEMHSRLVGEFTGWRGNTEFVLENGQVWRQAEAGRLVFQAQAPPVTIRRGAFNTYRLSVEGVNRAVRVRRVE